MGRQAWLAGALIAATFAGCIESPIDDIVPAETQSAVLDELGAIAPPATASTLAAWYALPMTATPEGALAAFEWTVPTGAVVPWGYNDVFDADESTIALELALLGDAPAEITWGLLSLLPGDEGSLEPRSGHLSAPESYVLYTSTDTTEADYDQPRVVFSDLGFDIEEGDLLRLLVVARAPEATELALAFRVLDHDPYYDGSDEEPASSPEAFVRERAGTPPTALPLRADGAGFELHGYADILFGGPVPGQMASGYEFTVGEPEAAWTVSHEERALGMPASFAGSVEGRLPHGFDAGGASYYTYGYERVSYFAETAMGGESHVAEGTEVSLGLVPLFVTGRGGAGGSAFASTELEGPSSTKLTFERTGAAGLVSLTSVSLLEFGATLEELFGTPGPAEAYADSEGGVLPVALLGPHGITQVREDGSFWTLAAPGPMPRTALELPSAP